MVLLVAHPRLSHFPGIIRFSYIFKRSDFNFGFKNYTAWLHVCNPLSKQNKLVVKSGKYQRWKQRCCSLCWELADGLEKLWRNKLFCDEFWSVRLKYRNAIEDCTPSCPQNHITKDLTGLITFALDVLKNRGLFCMSMRNRWLIKEHATSDSDRAA